MDPLHIPREGCLRDFPTKCTALSPSGEWPTHKQTHAVFACAGSGPKCPAACCGVAGGPPGGSPASALHDHGLGGGWGGRGVQHGENGPVRQRAEALGPGREAADGGARRGGCGPRGAGDRGRAGGGRPTFVLADGQSKHRRAQEHRGNRCVVFTNCDKMRWRDGYRTTALPPVGSSLRPFSVHFAHPTL